MLKVVLVMFKDDERRDFPLKTEKTLVGRRTDAGLRIPTRDVSREHCQLILSGDKLSVRDLDSSNGTFVNGLRVDEATLSPGDRLTVGPVNFVVQINGKPAGIQPSDAAPQLEDTDGAGAPFVFDEDDDDIDRLGGTPPKLPASKPAKPPAGKPAPSLSDDDDEEVLDLGDVDFELDLDDPTSDIQALLEDDDDDDDDPPRPPKKSKS